MAAQDKKISSLTQWLYNNIVDAANIVVAHSGENYRVAMSAIRQYVLGNRVINGTSFGDITTNGGEQILLNKRIDEPSFNNDVQLSYEVTATQMNHLSGLGQNVQSALNSIGSAISTIGYDIENLNSTVNALQADKIYSTSRGAAGTSITILASEISVNEIDPNSLSIFVYEKTSSSTMKLLNLSKIGIATSEGPLSIIEISEVVPQKEYQIVIRYRLTVELVLG